MNHFLADILAQPEVLQLVLADLTGSKAHPWYALPRLNPMSLPIYHPMRLRAMPMRFL